MAMGGEFIGNGPLVAVAYIIIITLRKWIPLFVLHVLLQVEERIEEDGRHLAPFQVGERDTAGRCRFDHIQHLERMRRGGGCGSFSIDL